MWHLAVKLGEGTSSPSETSEAPDFDDPNDTAVQLQPPSSPSPATVLAEDINNLGIEGSTPNHRLDA